MLANDDLDTNSEYVEIEGVVDRIVHDSKDGFMIIRIATRDGQKVTMKGQMPPMTEGASVLATGTPEVNAQHGLQYKVIQIEETGFSSADSLIRYLSSPTFKGIGMKLAKNIVDMFGLETLDVLSTDPQRLAQVPGLSTKWSLVATQWHENRAVHKIVTTLMKIGLTMNAALKAHKHFGDDVLEALKGNPYRLTEVSGIGFKIADTAALRGGFPRNSPYRAAAAALHYLEQQVRAGHCFMHRDDTVSAALALIEPSSLTEDAVHTVLDQLRDSGKTTEFGDRVYLTGIYVSERAVARRLHELSTDMAGVLVRDEADLDDLFSELGVHNEITLSDEQKKAVLMVLGRNRVSVITGGPGCGKSTLTRTICQALHHLNQHYELCSPTGRAAKRLSEVTGDNARTIHRLLKMTPDGAFNYDADNTLHTDVVIVDEASMVDILLMRHLLMALPDKVRLIIIGDADQLPAVGPGDVLRDLIRSGAVPVTRLTQVYRQAQNSAIIQTAHKILRKETLNLPNPRQRNGTNCVLVSADNPERLMDHIITLVTESIPKMGIRPEQIQVLSPQREYAVGVKMINKRLQAALNPEGPGKGETNSNNMILRAGDKVMQIRNDYKKGVFNGDIGKIYQVIKDDSRTAIIVAYPDMAENVEYASHEFDDLDLAYATTVHKCIKSSERVHTVHRGLVPIAQVEPGDLIHTGTKESKRVVGKFYAGEKPVFTLKTRSGYRIDASAEHPVLIRDASGHHFVAVGEMSQGMQVCISRDVAGNAGLAPLPIAGLASHLSLPEALGEDFAWALGATIGDGRYTDRKDGTVDITSELPEVLASWREVMQSFGLPVGQYRGEGRAATRLYVVSRQFREWLSAIGLDHVAAADKSAPDVIFRAGPVERGAFLRGLFDTNGSASVSPANILRFVTASPRLASDVQRLLLSVGVVSCVCGSGRAFTVLVSGPSVAVYAERVGFTVGNKRGRLLDILDRQGGRGKAQGDVIPHGEGIVSDVKAALKTHFGESGGGRGQETFTPYRVAVGTLLRRLGKGLNRLSYANLEAFSALFGELGLKLPSSVMELQALNYFYDTLETVEDTGKSCEMYDIEVEGTHSFVSNGFVCHNSQGSEYPAVVLVVHSSHSHMMQPKIIYTGLTRAKDFCVIAGDEKGLMMAVHSKREVRRNTTLAELLSSFRKDAPQPNASDG